MPFAMADWVPEGDCAAWRILVLKGSPAMLWSEREKRTGQFFPRLAARKTRLCVLS